MSAKWIEQASVQERLNGLKDAYEALEVVGIGVKAPVPIGGRSETR